MVATVLIPKQADQDARRLVAGLGESAQPTMTCKTIRVAGSRVYASGVFNLADLMPVGSSENISSGRCRAMPQQPHTLLPKADKSAPQVAGRKACNKKSTLQPPI